MNNLHNIHNNELSVQTLSRLSIDKKIELFTQGYRLKEFSYLTEPYSHDSLRKRNIRYSSMNITKMSNSDNIKSLTPACNITTKVTGQTVSLSATPSNGIAPYTVIFKKNGITIKTLTGITEGTNVPYQYTLLSTDTGSQVFSATTSYVCSDGSTVSNTESCTITVTSSSCIPDGTWHCELDASGKNTGYRLDSCNQAKILNTTICPVGSSGHHYSCVKGVCTIDDTTPGKFTDSNCGALQGECSCCDPDKNYCISGNCIPKDYLLYGSAGFIVLMLLTK